MGAMADQPPTFVRAELGSNPDGVEPVPPKGRNAERFVGGTTSVSSFRTILGTFS